MVTMTCMTTKKKFECETPNVILLKNKRYAYKVLCPWKRDDGKELWAFKFASEKAYNEQLARNSQEHSEMNQNKIATKSED